MKVTIKNRWSSAILYEMDVPDDAAQPMRVALEAAVKAGVDLMSADLAGANLAWANLALANLTEANLTWANLAGANLTATDLAEANLMGANLTGANLTGANLSGAYLTGACLTGANLSDAFVVPSLRFGEFLQIVPTLLTAGGKPLAEVANADTWSRHFWDNCPIHVAFGVNGPEEVPAKWRNYARLFVKLFDQGLIPLETVSGI